MARPRLNKSERIREAASANPGKTPAELAGILAAQGLKVKGQYVSTILSNARTKERRGRRTGRTIAVNGANGFGAVPAAIEFINAAGGLAAAKSALATVEAVASAIR
jgi:hypothetical protein